MKNLFIIMIIVLSSSMSFAQENFHQHNRNRTSVVYSDKLAVESISISECENCLVFNTMDWYNEIFICGSDGVIRAHANVRRLANRLKTDRIFICFDEWSDDIYTVIVSKGKKEAFIEINKWANDAGIIEE